MQAGERNGGLTRHLNDAEKPAWWGHAGIPGRPGIYFGEPWFQWFARVQKTRRWTPEDIRRAVYFWSRYPDFYAEALNTSAIGWLVSTSMAGTVRDLLCLETERRGWDSSAIRLTAEFRDAWLIENHEVAQDGGSWPPELLLNDPALTEQRRAMLLEAERLIGRLETLAIDLHQRLDNSRRPAVAQLDAAATETPSGNAAKQRRGGRKRDPHLEDLARIIREADQETPRPTDKDIAARYNKKYSRRERTMKASDVTKVRYRMKRQTRTLS